MSGESARQRRRLLALLASGETLQQATNAVGMTVAQLAYARTRDAELNAEIVAILGRASRNGDRRTRPLLHWLSTGMTLTAAAEAAGIPLPTVKRWRRSDLGFDQAVIAAAEGGTTLTPYSRIKCPGPRCGTPTGYDYGCREDACGSAAVKRVLEGRKADQERS